MLPETAHKIGSVPKIPCANTINTAESVIMMNFIDNAKNTVFAQGNPTAVCQDAVKKTGCGGRKILPMRITTIFDLFLLFKR